MMSVLLFIAIIVIICGFVWLSRLQKKNVELGKQIAATKEALLEKDTRISALENRDRQLIQNASEALFVFSQETGILLEVNLQAENLLGYTQGEVSNLTYKILFSREHQKKLLRMISRVIKHGSAEANGIKFRRKDGSQFLGDIKVRSGRLDGEKVVFGSFHDTTHTTNLQQELRRHNHHLSLLNEISHRVAEGHDLAHTLEIILDEVIKSFDISGGGIFLLEQNATEMKLALHRNVPGSVVEDLSKLKPGMGRAGKVASGGRPRLSTNLQKDHRRISRTVLEDGWRAFLAVPFIAEEETLGVLFIFDRGHKVFSREDVRLIQAIGRQLGPLLKNAELFDELQWQHRLNFASLRELERSRAILRDNFEHLEQHHRTLQSLNEMKSAFLSLASHELRTPLTTILSGAEFLQSETEDRLEENEKMALDVILRGSQRLNHIVDDLLEAARLEAKALYMAREPFNPKEMVNQLIHEFSAGATERKLHLELTTFPEECTLRGDIHHLKRSMSRLLENALKFTPEDGWVRVTGQILPQEEVSAREEVLRKFSETFFDAALATNYLQISFCDSGIGIEEEDQVRIFDKFQEVGDISGHSTSTGRFGGKGVGLGLTLSKGIIETHEGLLWVESAGHSQGSCFSILLPVADHLEGEYVLG